MLRVRVSFVPGGVLGLSGGEYREGLATGEERGRVLFLTNEQSRHDVTI